MGYSKLGAAALATWSAFSAAADGNIYWRQRHDFRGMSPSEENTLVPSARTADDFFTTTSFFTLVSVTVSMIVNWPEPPDQFGVTFYYDRPGKERGPGQEYGTFVRELSVVDRGEWNGHADLHLVDVTMDGFSAVLGRDTYWLSAYAIGEGSGRAWWGTSGRGDVRQSEGYFMSEHFGVPDWTPISQSGILDFPTDFAFTIEATDIPAPGALPLLAAFGMLGNPRRRGR